MTRRRRHSAALSAAAIAACATLLCAGGAAASTLSPLPEADYSVRAVCTAPAPGEAACLALQLVPQTAEARAHTHPLGMARPAAAPSAAPAAAGRVGLRPRDLHGAYSLPLSATSTQTIALVDAYNDPSAEADLKVYDEEFGLPECTNANGCFTQLNQTGKATPLPFPKTNGELEAFRAGTSGERKAAERATGWGSEISLDIETAHAICQNCKIALLEAETSAYPNLEAAERSAVKLGAGEISNSWGGPEEGETPQLETTSAFNDPGVVVTASAGDDGYLGWDAASSAERGFADFPASSPHVVAVGGTHLEVAEEAWTGETVWNGDGAGGGGCSTIFEAPLWQQNAGGFSKVGCHRKRAVSDISADADPYTGLAVRDTSPACKSQYVEEGTLHELAHWCTIGGTSLASPLIASVFALAGGAKGAPYPARTLYQNELALGSSFNDVSSGSNGECTLAFQSKSGLSGCTIEEEALSCADKRICVAASGYDGPSGLGTPNGLSGFVRSSEDAAALEEAAPPEEAEEQAEPEKRSGQPEEPSSGGGKSEPPPGGGTTSSGSGAQASGAATTPPGPIATVAKDSVAIRVSALALTHSAVVALNRSRPRLSAVDFQFTITAPARVRATLAKRVRRNHRVKWSTLRSSAAFSARAGRGSARLTGGSVLAPGTYRLTLAPSSGAARSIVFHIG
jgi:Subtilase family